MRKFKAGDRVVVLTDSWDVGLKNKVATVVGFGEHSSGREEIDIKVDDWTCGHYGSTGAPSEKSDRWNVYEDDIELVDQAFLDSVLDELPTYDDSLRAKPLLPTDAASRKKIPLGSGVFDYFTAALIEIAKVSFEGNQQHNPGQSLHWAQDKSNDHFDTALRHLAERGTRDTDGQRHSAKAAWRVLALLQMELQNEGYPKPRGAR